ncbi:MAG: FMN-binding protein [Ignavibacteriaceae bacterium]
MFLPIIMKKNIITILILLSQLYIFPQEIKERTEEIITSAFKEKISLEMQKYAIPADIKSNIEKEVRQRFFDKHVFVYKISNGSSLKGYAILDNVYGKSMPITFLVIFDTSGNIISSDIVKYREPYGGAVSGENWNRQFAGKNDLSGFTVGKDIDGISGATISVNSVTKGIEKLTRLIREIKNRI